MRRFCQVWCSLLALMAATAPAEEPPASTDAANVPITKAYAVGDLVVPLSRNETTSIEPDFESLIDLIELRTGADCWAEDGLGSLDEHARSLSLVVRQTEQVHRRIADILEELRHTGDIALLFDGTFIEGPISKLDLASPGRSLSGLIDEAGKRELLEQAKASPEFNTLFAPKLTTFNGVTAMVKQEGQFELEMNGVTSRDGRYVRLWTSVRHSEHAVRSESLIPDGYSVVREIVPGKMLAVFTVKILDSAQPEEALAALPHPMPAQRYDVPEHDHAAEDPGHVDGVPAASPGDLRPPVQNAELPADDVRQGTAEPRQLWSRELAAQDFGSAINVGPKFVTAGIFLFGNVHTGITANIPIVVANGETINSLPQAGKPAPGRVAWQKPGAAAETIHYVPKNEKPVVIASPLLPNSGREFASVLPWTSDILHAVRRGVYEEEQPKRLPVLFELVDSISNLKPVEANTVQSFETGVARVEDSIDFFTPPASITVFPSPVAQCSGETDCGIAFTSAHHATVSSDASPFESQLSKAVASLRDAGMQNEADELERFRLSLGQKLSQRIEELDRQIDHLGMERRRLQERQKEEKATSNDLNFGGVRFSR